MKFKNHTIAVTVLSLLVVSLSLYIYFDKSANGLIKEKWIYVENRTDSRECIEEEMYIYDRPFHTIGKGKIVDGIIKIDIYDAYVISRRDYIESSRFRIFLNHIEDSSKKVSYNAADGIVYIMFDSIDELSDYVEREIEK